MNDFVDDFLQGQRDCDNGIPHKDGSDAYNRGYNAQYESEQIKTERNRQQEKTCPLPNN